MLVTVCSCIASRRADCVFGGRAIDFVGQDQIGKERPGHEPHRAGARRRIVLQKLHADDVGRHHVGRELDPLEAPGQDLSDRFDQQASSPVLARR